jgi:uncharacterized protein YidB (DUF937 family)
MARGFPSMTALLGLLAVAGYQNRDKLAELLKNATGPANTSGSGLGNTSASGLGGLLGGIGSGGLGGLLANGLSELKQRFEEAGQGEAASSWIGTDANKQISTHELRTAIGPEVLAHLSQQTGMDESELLSRLSRDLSNAVDKYTPNGQLPAA